MKDAIEDFRLHPYISNLLRDGTVVEYSAHLVREGGVEDIMDKPYGDGYVVVGDATGFLLNTGFTIRGVDYAMESGRLATNAVIKPNIWRIEDIGGIRLEMNMIMNYIRCVAWVKEYSVHYLIGLEIGLKQC